MPERNRPNGRTQGIGYYLAENVAPRITEAQHHLQRERTICDGWAAKGESAGRGGGPTIHVDADQYETEGRIAVTGVEASALARTNIDTQLDNITNAINGLQVASDHLAECVKRALRSRAPEPLQVPRCRDGQVGRDGAIVWGRPDCVELPTKALLCDRCYLREWRWRSTQELLPREVEPAGFHGDSTYHAR